MKNSLWCVALTMFIAVPATAKVPGKTMYAGAVELGSLCIVVNPKDKIPDLTPNGAEGIKPKVFGSRGTGIVLKSNEILTAAHVIIGAAGVARACKAVGGVLVFHGILLHEQKRVVGYEVIELDEKLDLALLRTFKPLRRRPVQLAERPARLGESVYYAGVRPDFGYIYLRHAIVAREVVPGDEKRTHMFVLDGVATPGNSGCPVYNKRGRLVGVMLQTAMMRLDNGRQLIDLGFAANLQTIKAFLHSARKGVKHENRTLE